MEVDEGENQVDVSTLPKLDLGVAREVKLARDQHGLKHEDYYRYRTYCTKRLKRLYKTLKLCHGRGKTFIKHEILPVSITDERSLLVPLICAERCWAQAMEVKNSSGGNEIVGKKRRYLLKKLKKGTRYAQLLQSVATERAGSMTCLEVEAYVSAMKGTYLLEQEKNWKGALEHLSKARTVYEHLSKTGGLEQATLFTDSRDRLDPSIRYCQYNLGEDKEANLQMLQSIAKNDAALQSKFEKVLEQAKTQAAEGVTTFKWYSRDIPVFSAVTRLNLHNAREAESILDERISKPKDDTEGEDSIMTLYDKLFVYYDDAAIQTRKDMASVGESEKAHQDLRDLEIAVSEAKLRRMSERTRGMIDDIRQKVDRQIDALSMGQLGKEERMDKAARPDDLVRVYENLQQNVEELGELAEKSEFLEEHGVLFECAALRGSTQAYRCYYIAMSYAMLEKYPEAYLLVSRAAEYTDDAEERAMRADNNSVCKMVIQDMRALKETILVQKTALHVAGYCAEIEEENALPGEIGEMTLAAEETKAGFEPPEPLPLRKRLAEYKPALQIKGAKGLSTLADLPPSFMSLPGKPITLDTAIYEIKFPPTKKAKLGERDEDAEEEEEEEEEEGDRKEQTGFMSSIFGWGAKS